MKAKMMISVLAVLAMAATATATTTIPVGETGLGNDLYVTDDGGVWEETNGLDGLQTTGTVLEDGTLVPADERLA